MSVYLEIYGNIKLFGFLDIAYQYSNFCLCFELLDCMHICEGSCTNGLETFLLEVLENHSIEVLVRSTMEC